MEAAAIVERCGHVATDVFALELQPFKSEGEKQALHGFVGRAADIASYLMEHKRDAAALASLEADVVRPLATDVRAYSLRRHLTCCRPMWGARKSRRSNELAVFGSAELESKVRTVAGPLGLRVAGAGSAATPDRWRWDAVCGSNFSVFELTGQTYAGGLWPDICHALGIALGVGSFPVIVTDRAVRLPFDIPLEPVEVRESDDATGVIADALATAALAQFQIDLGDSSVAATVDYVLSRVDERSPAARLMRGTIEGLVDGERTDPVTAQLYLASLLEAAGRGGHELLTPMWAGAYPDRDAARCFHVLPFALPREVSRAVDAGCGDKAAYERGDTTGEIDVIEGIWGGLCRASHVVVDVTPANVDGNEVESVPNPNVCLELAMAQTLGRNLLLVRDARAAEAPLFPAIAKLQVLPYSSVDELESHVRTFVASDARRVR